MELCLAAARPDSLAQGRGAPGPHAVKILLTGATGFIGCHAARSLLARGHEVRVAIRENSGTSRIVDILPSLERVTCNLWSAPPSDLEALCRDVELVLHTAWYAVPGQYLAARENLECTTGTLRLIEAAADARVRRFVGVGTCF